MTVRSGMAAHRTRAPLWHGCGAVPPDAAPVATLAILNYNGRALLERMLPTVFAQTARDFTVQVLDDGSTDDSLEYLAEHWPGVEVLPAERNAGITASMARAVASARTPYVALLNNDLELDARWLEEMLAAAARHPGAAAFDGKMLQSRRRTHLDGAGDWMEPAGYPRRRGEGEPDRGQYDREEEVFAATGGAALYRRDAFDVVGPFDVDFYAYYEDVDWGFRARLHGLATWYVPTAVSYHLGSATTSQTAGRFAALVIRNQVTMTVKDFPPGLLWRRLPRILFFQAKWLAFDVVHRRGRAHVRGLAQALRALPATLRKRRQVQRARTAGAREIAAAMGCRRA
jgi:GT2 family glycosyltransferase